MPLSTYGHPAEANVVYNCQGCHNAIRFHAVCLTSFLYRKAKRISGWVTDGDKREREEAFEILLKRKKEMKRKYDLR